MSDSEITCEVSLKFRGREFVIEARGEEAIDAIPGLIRSSIIAPVAGISAADRFKAELAALNG